MHQDVAFVKIDVEGHELSVLNGAVAFLMQRVMPRRVAVATMGKATRKMYR